MKEAVRLYLYHESSRIGPLAQVKQRSGKNDLQIMKLGQFFVKAVLSLDWQEYLASVALLLRHHATAKFDNFMTIASI